MSAIGPRRRPDGLAARHGVRVRDARGRRRLLAADGDPKVVLPEGKRTLAPAGGSASATRVISDWVAAKVTDVLEQNVKYGTGTGAASDRRRPARRARPRSTPTPGSAATRRGSRRRVWVGYPNARCRWRTCTGSRSPAARSRRTIWRDFMTAALGRLDTVEFPEPTDWPRVDDIRARHVRPVVRLQREQDSDYVAPETHRDDAVVHDARSAAASPAGRSRRRRIKPQPPPPPPPP